MHLKDLRGRHPQEITIIDDEGQNVSPEFIKELEDLVRKYPRLFRVWLPKEEDPPVYVGGLPICKL